jgi:hypothetical protein
MIFRVRADPEEMIRGRLERFLYINVMDVG